MRLCSLITGVTRPDPMRVFLNITQTLKTLQKFDVDYKILTYKTDKSIELEHLLRTKNYPVSFYLIDPIVPNFGGHNGNIYRMFKSIETLINSVENFSEYDCVLRHRIDCSLLELTIPWSVENEVYYAPRMPWGDIFDNIAIAKPETMKRVFNTNLNIFNESDPHKALQRSLELNSINRSELYFKKLLFQSSSEKEMDIPQWSKKNRLFHYTSTGWHGFE